MSRSDHPSLAQNAHIEYVIRFEGDDMVCFLQAGANFIELYRVEHGCADGDTEMCLEQLNRCQLMCEDDYGTGLPWIVSQDPENDPRLSWTGTVPTNMNRRTT